MGVIQPGEWAQSRGEGNIREAFDEDVERIGEQAFVVTLVHRRSQMGATSDPLLAQSKKAARKQAAERLWEVLGARSEAPAPAAVVPKTPASELAEWAQKRGLGTWSEAFAEEAVGHPAQCWELILTVRSRPHLSVSSGVVGTKKEAKHVAAQILLEAVTEEPSLAAEALIGDKVMGLCLALHLFKRGERDTGQMTATMSGLLSNATQQQAHARKLGILPTGNTHHDGSLVEREVCRIFFEEEEDVGRTAARLEGLWS